jgi:uroporphyrinogen decarboxylase
VSAALQNDLFLRALLRESTPRTPLWMMRQAGRYLPEYRATRTRAGSFLQLCMNPELACEVTLQPLERYRLDAAILFSDILTVPHAMNVGVEFEAGEGPRIARPVRTPADIDKLPVPDPEVDLRYVMDAVRAIRRELHGRVPLLGFAGSPLDRRHVHGRRRQQPEFRVHQGPHVRRATRAASPARRARAVDDCVPQRADCGGRTSRDGVRHLGGSLTPAGYREFSFALHAADRRRADAGERGPARAVDPFYEGRGPVARGNGRNGLRRARRRLDDRFVSRARGGARAGGVAGQPGSQRAVRVSGRIREQVGRVLASFGHGHGHVFNLGHGIHPGVEPDHALAMVEAVHELSPPYHR